MRRLWVIGVVVATGCHAEESAPPPIVVPPTGSCQAPELELPDGSCMRPGILPEGCSEGFAHDGEYGCDPILPADPCPTGLMAVPGETVCRPVMPCGRGKWGDIPVDATTQYVDIHYAGITSDGSAEQPWTSIVDAYAAVAPGGVIAVAEGHYPTAFLLADKPARIWGVCPEKAQQWGNILIGEGADGSELHGLGLSGPYSGVVLSGVHDVLLDRLWVTGTSNRGIELNPIVAPASARLTASLIEDNHEFGVLLAAATLHMDTTVVRRGVPLPPDQVRGVGVQAQDCGAPDGCSPLTRSDLTIERSIIEENHLAGVYVIGSDVHIEATVVRGTLPSAALGNGGRGIVIELACDENGCYPETAATATIRGSVIERNHEIGMSMVGSDAIVENTVVRETRPRESDQGLGRGVSVEVNCLNGVCFPDALSRVEVRRLLVERHYDFGLAVMGSEALIEDTVVRSVLPRVSDQKYGRGLVMQAGCPPAGPYAMCNPEAPSIGTVRRSLIDDNYDVGVLISSSTATLEAMVVRATHARAADNQFGDGIAVVNDFAPASANATRVLVQDSARAGVSNFGAFVSIGATAVQCAAFDLEGEALHEPFTFEDGGDNRCGCPIADATCVAVSPGLEPPASLPE